MTEKEYNFIRSLENDCRSVLKRMSNIENIKDPAEIIDLHGEIGKTLDIIFNLINAKTVTSQHGVYLLEQMKLGLCEMLTVLDEMIP